MLARWDLSRILQLMHAEAVRRGGSFEWLHYFEPDPALLERFDSAAAPDADWNIIEPSFS